ncbi:methyl-accepting chemotaxis protein [Pullulanibacillus pueri]|nr:methyl-accepting chemotaxis protein [Pullulanibacillus pueri]
MISFLIILIVPICFSTYFSLDSTSKKMDEQITSSAQNSVKIVNQTIDQFISAQEQNIDYLSHAIDASAIQDDKDEATRTLLNQIQDASPNVEQTYIGTETGSFMNAPTSFKNPPGYDPRERPWYQEAMKNKGKAIITEPYVSQSSKKMVVTIAQATKDGKGVVAVNLKLDSLTNMMSKIKIGESGYLILLDQTNKYISHPTEKAGTTPKLAVYKKVNKLESGQFNYQSDDAEKKMVFATNDLTGWKIVGTMYQSEVTDAVHPILLKSLIVLIVALILGGALIYFVVRMIIRPIKQLIRSADEVSQGDLRKPIVLKSKDEIGQLGRSFEQMRSSLVTVISEISEKATSLAASSEELSASTDQNSQATQQITQAIQELGIGAEQQSRSIEASTQSALDMVQTIQEIATSSNKVSSTAVETTHIVKEGNEAIEVTVEQMQSIKKTVSDLAYKLKTLSQHSANIGQIIGVITEIADQTNLLALNAAIEAARAGEQGKGFAVVADEVRKLAEQSATSTDKIRQVITTIQSETDEALKSMELGKTEVDKGIDIVNHAGESFKNIKQFVDEVTSQIQNVSASVQEINAGTEQNVKTFEEVSEISEQTSAGVQDVSASTEEQLASMEEISSSAEVLSEMAEELQQIIEKFKV